MARHAPATFAFAFGAAQVTSTGQPVDANVPVALQVANPGFLAAGPAQSAIVTSDGELFVWGIIRQTNSEALIALRRETNSHVVAAPTSVLTPLLSAKMVAIDDGAIVVLTPQGTLLDLADEPKPWRSIVDARAVFARYGLLVIFDAAHYFVVADAGAACAPSALPNGEVPATAAISRGGYAILSDRSTLYFFGGAGQAAMADVVSVAAAADRFVVLRPDARVYEVMAGGARRQVAGIEGHPVRVFAGGAHFGCVTLEGACWAWGCGNRGQLGNGRFTVALAPSRVLLKDGFCAVDAVAGEEHTMLLAVKDDAFVPRLPERMKANPYMAMVRLANALPGALVASELDAKF